MAHEQIPTVAVVSDLWPSVSEPHLGSFVRAQIESLGDRYRHVVLVPRLLAPAAHASLWGRTVQGWQQGWEEPPLPGRLLRYPMLRVPKGAEVRVPGAMFALARARERPALVHGHFLHEVGVAAVGLGRRLGVPSIVTVHGTDGRWLAGGGVQDRYRQRMLAAARAADRVLVVEKGLATQVVAAGVPEERVEVVPMGVDERVFRPRSRHEARERLGIEESRSLVVFVGRATPEKGVGVLEDALDLLGHGVRGVCVGPGSTPRGRIEVLGAQRPEEVVLWLAAADVFCLPSFAEGMPVSVAEALASGRPIVACAVGGIPEQVDSGRTGLLVPPGDPRALAQALRSALDRPWSEVELRAASEPFWWSSVAPRIAAIYERVLGA